MRWLGRGLLGVGAVVLILVGVGRYEQVRSSRFDQAHPLMTRIRSAWREHPAQRDAEKVSGLILLQRLPLKSARQEAVAVLSSEGFECDPMTGGLPRPPGLLVCWGPAERRWHVELMFSADDGLVSGRVVPPSDSL